MVVLAVNVRGDGAADGDEARPRRDGKEPAGGHDAFEQAVRASSLTGRRRCRQRGVEFADRCEPGHVQHEPAAVVGEIPVASPEPTCQHAPGWHGRDHRRRCLRRTHCQHPADARGRASPASEATQLPAFRRYRCGHAGHGDIMPPARLGALDPRPACADRGAAGLTRRSGRASPACQPILPRAAQNAHRCFSAKSVSTVGCGERVTRPWPWRWCTTASRSRGRRSSRTSSSDRPSRRTAPAARRCAEAGRARGKRGTPALLRGTRQAEVTGPSGKKWGAFRSLNSYAYVGT